MNKKITKIALGLLILFFILFLGIYFLVAHYFQTRFVVNTWINGVYCTGKTVEEVNNELLKNKNTPFLILVGNDGKQEIIQLSNAEYSQDMRPILYPQFDKQNAFGWPIYLWNEQRTEIVPVNSWNDELLKELILNSETVKKVTRDVATVKVEIIKGENGYQLYDGMSDVFNPVQFTDKVIENFKNDICITDVSDENFYFVQKDSSRDKYERDLWAKLDDFLDIQFVLDMGAEKITFDKELMSDFVLLDKQGEFVLNENNDFLFDAEKLTIYIHDLLQKYNTAGTYLKFHTTNGDFVEVKYNKYGTKIDVEAETEYIVNALLNKVNESYIPEYIQEGYVRGLNDIGNTYIEVDMTMQKLYAYKDGELLVETDIVTGNMRRNWDTPEGVNYVYAKQKKRILRGANYATPVDYWMPVVGNIGLHDANWRKAFGGEIYQTDGSHGCVNIPTEIMPIIYDNFEVGTPVIMFY